MTLAEERKKRRLEAWRKKQEAAAAPAPKVSMSLALGGLIKKKKKKKTSNNNKTNVFSGEQVATNKRKKTSNPFFADDEGDSSGSSDNDDEALPSQKTKLLSLETITATSHTTATGDEDHVEAPPRKRSRGRWDKAPTTTTTTTPLPPSSTTESSTTLRNETTTQVQTEQQAHDDALDKFMEKLEAGAMGNVTTQRTDEDGSMISSGLNINVTGSMMPRKSAMRGNNGNPISGGVITPEELERLNNTSHSHSHRNGGNNKKSGNPTQFGGAGGNGTMEQDAMDLDDDGPRYTHSDWESESGKSEPETDDEEEEKARRAFIEALKSVPMAADEEAAAAAEILASKKPELAAEVKSEKQRRELHMKQLEEEAEKARQLAQAAGAPDLGRLYNDTEGGVMEEAERNLDAAMAAPDALVVLAELNKKKELKSVDHSKMDYIDFKKNLYVVPRALANLSNDEVLNLRAKLKVRVRGHGAPAPVSTFEQCGLSEKILKMLEKQKITKPYPVQAQCIPCIMAGRDVIGIAKTGSGKTLAYVLPMLRHIMVQPPLEPHESGPIGLILAPARELAYQIHIVCKTFCKNLGLK